MIKVDDILKIVKLILLSGYLKKHKPLSLLLVGEVGIGKTEISTNYSSSRIIVINDLSKMGLYNEIRKNKSLKHIIIPDFLKITQRRKTTANDLISTLNSAVEEGLTKVSLYHHEENFKSKNIGIITSTTKSSLEQHYKKWKEMGFVSRMLICSYSYCDDTIEKIMKYIIDEEYLNNNLKQRLKGFKDINITSTPELNKQLKVISKSAFRNQKQLQTLIKCNTLLRGDNKTNQEDVNEIIRLTKFLNLNYLKI